MAKSESGSTDARRKKARQVRRANLSAPDHDSGADLLSAREAFADLAARHARGEILMPPLLLPDYERRKHIRATLIEDHTERLQNRPDAVRDKCSVMAKSVFRFFRGTALLYYRDHAGTDASWPVVLCLGDVHPKNFGVMPSVDGTPVFGPNDFDEAHFAPFSYDVKRGAVGFELAMRDEGQKKARRQAVKEFVTGYLASLDEFSRDDSESTLSFRIDNSPPMIRDLLEQSRTIRSEWLNEIIDLDLGRFEPTDEIVPLTSRIEEFQSIVEAYQKSNQLSGSTVLTEFTVKDVALKKGSGTASLGLDRYFVLIDGPGDDSTDDLILEIKQARESAMMGLVPIHLPDSKTTDAAADRVVSAQAVHLAGGDPYYGGATIDGRSFMVRERSPLKDAVDLDDLDADEWVTYAGICGRVLALAHARSDGDTGVQSGDAEKAILASVARHTFPQDMLDFAESAGKRIRRDWKLFREDFDRGVFEPH